MKKRINPYGLALLLVLVFSLALLVMSNLDVLAQIRFPVSILYVWIGALICWGVIFFLNHIEKRRILRQIEEEQRLNELKRNEFKRGGFYVPGLDLHEVKSSDELAADE